jgi:DegV family protein with EDD domain
VITVSSCLSGTYQSARIAAQDYENVRVVDSMNVSIASGVLALYALRCAENGMGLDELARHLTEKREEIGLVAMVDTLEYLKKGGRISGAAALAGGVLNIKPVLTCRDGVLAVIGKARGSKKANNLLAEQIRQDNVDFSMPLLLGYTGLSDEMLRQYIQDSRYLWEGHVAGLERVQLSSVVGTHAGPGAVAVAYFKSGAVK